MRILELGKFYPPHYGGIETLLQLWAEGFASRGAAVECVVANDRARTVHERLNGVQVHRLASFGQCFSTSVCPGYFRATRRYRADLWHVHFPNPLADAACLLGPRGVPLVLTYHSDIVRQAGLLDCYRPCLERLLRRASRIVVATPPQLEYSPWLAPFRDKCDIIPFGLDLDRRSGGADCEAQAMEWRRSTRGLPILLNIGRLVPYKGQRHLIEAARDLKAMVWIVGSGPLEAELKALARELGIAERVRFLGALDDRRLAAVLRACDIFVLPSVTPNEAFGLVQVEAMSCGKPVVSCSLRSGVPYVNLDGVTGRVVRPADSGALADALRRLLSNPSLRQRLGQAGRERARSEFALEIMIDRYQRCFEDLTGKPLAA